MSVSVVCEARGSWTGVHHSRLCSVGVKLVLSSPVLHHPLDLSPWALDFFPYGMEILANPALWSVELHCIVPLFPDDACSSRTKDM